MTCNRNNVFKEIKLKHRFPKSKMAVQQAYLIEELETDPEILQKSTETINQKLIQKYYRKPLKQQTRIVKV